MHCVSWTACLMVLSSVSRFPTGIGAILWVWIFVAYILYHILMFPWFHLLFMTLTCQLIKSSCFYTQSLSHIFSFSNPTNHDQVNAAFMAFIVNHMLLRCVLHQQYTGVCVYVYVSLWMCICIVWMLYTFVSMYLLFAFRSMCMFVCESVITHMCEEVREERTPLSVSPCLPSYSRQGLFC